MPHYYDEKQAGPLRPFRIPVRARGQEFELWSAAGVFSKEKVDRGTQLLLDRAILQDGWKVHDLGCGYGAVGIVVKRSCPSCGVVCSDVSGRAVQLTRKNAKERGLDIDVRKSDGYEKVPEKFDTVLFNPPYVAGRKTVFRLIEQAADHLVPGGLLQVVARHRKGGKAIMEHLERIFGNCDDSRKGSGYRVYVAVKMEQ